MKKCIFILSITFLCLEVYSSSLEEQIDALTPEETNRIINKLRAKPVKPIPEEFFTKLSVSLSLGIQSNKQDEFYSTVDPKFSADDNHEMPFYGNVSFLWHIDMNYRLGVGLGRFGNEMQKEISSGIFEEIMLSGYYIQVQGGRLFEISERWVIAPIVGVGYLKADAMRMRSNDNATSSYEYKYEGADLMASIVVSINYALNPVFHLGVESGYLYSEVGDLKRSGETSISTPNKLDFGGPFWGLKISLNL